MVLSQRQGLYVAPKIQGVYHITATSTANPQKRGTSAFGVRRVTKELIDWAD
jgi:hypothetical protein